MTWKHRPIVAFDTETTGLDPHSGDRIIEVALVVFHVNAHLAVTSRVDHSWLINPGIPIPRMITQITGIKDDDVAQAPPFAVVAEEVASLMSGAVAVAHNLPFDHAFLMAEFTRAQATWTEPDASIDTVDLSMRVFPEARGHKLGDVARRLDVSLVEAHRATNDAAACGLAFIEMARRASVGDDLQGLLDWAEAIGRPPPGGLTVDSQGLPVFAEGPHQQEPVTHHPLHLAWMEKARVRTQFGWDWRFNEPTRRWIRRWLTVRTAGRTMQNAKGFHASDWGLDPCITDDRRRAAL